MFRPAKITHPVVVNDGKPFEGMSMELSFHIRDQDLYMTNYDDDKNDYIFHQSFRFNTLKELQDAKYSVQWQLAQALNPPIKVTQAVLDAMEKVPSAKFHLIDKAPKKRIELYPLFWNDEDAEWFVIGGYFDIGDYIQADCPLALQVLLGFTIEGVPKDD
jgi:hypothetical protein